MKITALTDYKGYFGSKWDAIPYRSGMDKDKIAAYFAENSYQCAFKKFEQVNLGEVKEGDLIIYSSTEDSDYRYKSFIEDIVLSIELSGALVIPKFVNLRATNNKVMMELLKNIVIPEQAKHLPTLYFGALNKNGIKELQYPLVVKAAGGAGSKFVFLAHNFKELIKRVKDVSYSSNISLNIKEKIRLLIHKGYYPESKYRNKFIIQKYIANLQNDWKVLVFGKKYFVLMRYNRKNDFRASGSGNFIFPSELPAGLLDFCQYIFEKLGVPNVSLDIAFDGEKFLLIEFQAIFFGSYTLTKSKYYFTMHENRWEKNYGEIELEKIYVESIINFIEQKKIEINAPKYTFYWGNDR